MTVINANIQQRGTSRWSLAATTTLLTLSLLASGCGSGGGNRASSPVPSVSEPAPSTSTAPSPSAPSAAPSLNPTPPPSTTPSQTGEAGKAEAIVERMTLEEKIGQMIMIGVVGTSLDETAKSLIRDRHIGGVIVYKDNLGTLAGSVKLVNAMKAANADNKVPLLLGVDQEGGRVARLPKDFESIPSSATVGATNDASLAEELGGLLAEEVGDIGLNLNFAPVLDINSNPKNPVIGDRSYGNSAKLVSKMGLAEMKGMREGGVIPVVKHFPGHGDTSVDSHLALPVVNKTTEQLKKMEWLPFQAAIQDGADMVLVAHILFPNIDADAPASFSKVIIGDQLRGTLGYDGVVITDEMTMGAIADHYGTVNASVRSIEAGSDIVMVAFGYDKMAAVYDELLKAAKDGSLSEARIDESARRIVALKLKYGLTNEPTAVPAASDLPNAKIRAWKAKLK